MARKDYDTEYELFDLDEIPESVDWEKVKELEGIPIELKEVEYGRGKRKVETKVITLVTSDGKRYGIWHSYKLSPLFDYFDIIKGNKIKVVYEGMKKIKGGQRLKQFKLYLPKSLVTQIRKELDNIPF